MGKRGSLSFFDFLRSGENDIDAFADSKCSSARGRYVSCKTRSHIERCGPVPEKLEG